MNKEQKIKKLILEIKTQTGADKQLIELNNILVSSLPINNNNIKEKIREVIRKVSDDIAPILDERKYDFYDRNFTEDEIGHIIELYSDETFVKIQNLSTEFNISLLQESKVIFEEGYRKYENEVDEFISNELSKTKSDHNVKGYA